VSARLVREGQTYRIEGPVTMANVESLLEEGRRQFEGTLITVDLGGVTEADSSALSLLLQWMREAAAPGRRIALANLPAGLQSLAVLYGIDQLLVAPASADQTRA